MDEISDFRFLVVEDEKALRSLSAEVLRDQGFDVTEMANADEALNVLADPDNFDILFTDVRMPGLHDGLDLASEARRLHPDIPILVTSGFAANIEARIRARNQPILFISKPYDLHKLVKVVQQLLDRRPKPS